MGPPCSRQAAAPYYWLCLSLTLVLGELRSTVGMFVCEINIDMAADAESLIGTRQFSRYLAWWQWRWRAFSTAPYLATIRFGRAGE